MSIRRKALKAAFPHTIPVLTGYMFLGIAFGLLLNSKGYGPGWAVLMSILAFAGSAQYLAISFLSSAFNPLYAFLMTLIVNARHLFYGISMLNKYKNTGKKKPYLIFGLTDETFSIVCSAKAPKGVDQTYFMFFVTLLDHIYWVSGSLIGSLLGSVISLNTKGLDFVLTALFTVIFVDQWKAQKNHLPALIGVFCSLACLLIFGPDSFIIPSMAAILIALTLTRRINDIENNKVEELAG
ncbi:MAG: AzlC family ABC transporter permease [Caldicoprobacterales bacterium]|nr:AzlC family ABC transporter permease [Clostridia bacterium]MDI9512709.1 AzlC family ABC transporter permease [Bacillota bacterium]NLH59212.1 branched-chain amino acid ABC transporter permease [Clostridiales bacterium]